MAHNVNTIIGIVSRMPESFMASPGGRQVYTFRRPSAARRRFHLETMADGSATAIVSYISDKKPGIRRRRILRFVIKWDPSATETRSMSIRGREPITLGSALKVFDLHTNQVDVRLLVDAAHAPPIVP